MFPQLLVGGIRGRQAEVLTDGGAEEERLVVEHQHAATLEAVGRQGAVEHDELTGAHVDDEAGAGQHQRIARPGGRRCGRTRR